jgi:hypothetical protein
MATAAEKLVEALTHLGQLRTAVEKEADNRKQDHDEIIKLVEQNKTLFKKIEGMEKRAWAIWLGVVLAFVGGLGTILFELVKHLGKGGP